jgi:hypothetical protein
MNASATWATVSACRSLRRASAGLSPRATAPPSLVGCQVLAVAPDREELLGGAAPARPRPVANEEGLEPAWLDAKAEAAKLRIPQLVSSRPGLCRVHRPFRQLDRRHGGHSGGHRGTTRKETGGNTGTRGTIGQSVYEGNRVTRGNRGKSPEKRAFSFVMRGSGVRASLAAPFFPSTHRRSAPRTAPSHKPPLISAARA